jgi:hypothetical protein
LHLFVWPEIVDLSTRSLASEPLGLFETLN